MNAETFFENFSLLSESPNGIQKLREMILQMAVQGKLVPQNPDDEPAEVLLKRIKAEKERLVKEGKIRKSKTPPLITEKEIPYDIPILWQWVRFGEITLCRDGERIPLSRSERNKRKGEFDYYGASGVIDKIDDFLFDKPLLLIGEDGANLLRRSTPIAFIAKGKYWVNNHAHVLDGMSFDFLRYLEVYINATDLTPYVTGSAQPKMNQTKMNSIPVALPPLEEQKRIVAKVDQLMELCDQLESLQQKKQESHIHLNNAALNKMLDASSPEEFEENWRLVCENFGLLYDNLENVEKLRQSILQLAVMGKLVEQDADDEPAEVLLEKIKTEKDRLVKEKKIRKSKSLPTIEKEEIPYMLPLNWRWVRLSEVVHNFGQKKPDGDFTYIDVSSINKELGIISKDVQYLSPKNAPSRARKIVKKGCVIYSTVRPYLLNIAIVDKEFNPEPIVSTAFAVLNPHSGLDAKYLYFYLRSQSFINYVEYEMSGMAYPAINDSKLYKGLVPLPPLEEQKRIVAKVNQLMELCDRLEADIRQAQEDGEKLMEVAVSGLLASCD